MFIRKKNTFSLSAKQKQVEGQIWSTGPSGLTAGIENSYDSMGSISSADPFAFFTISKLKNHH